MSQEDQDTHEYAVNCTSTVVLEGANDDTQSFKSTEGPLGIQRRPNRFSMFSCFAGTGTEASLHLKWNAVHRIIVHQTWRQKIWMETTLPASKSSSGRTSCWKSTRKIFRVGVALSSTMAFAGKAKAIAWFWSVMKVIGSWWRFRILLWVRGVHDSWNKREFFEGPEVRSEEKLIPEAVSGLGASGVNQASKNKWDA